MGFDCRFSKQFAMDTHSVLRGPATMPDGSYASYRQRYSQWQTLPEIFFDKAEELSGQPMLWAKTGAGWQPLTWRQVAEQVRRLAAGLRGLGIKPGDRIVLVSESQPEWVIADLAVMTVGAITVPAYTTNTVADHLHIMRDSGASLAIVSTAALAERTLAAAVQCDDLNAVICVEPPADPAQTGLPVHLWNDVMSAGDDGDQSTHPSARPSTACLIYTSGTGGTPKGVVLSHGAIICNCLGAFDLFAAPSLLDIDQEVFLSFLPLSHSYEHTAGLHFPITIGAQIYYAESIDRLSANMTEAHPTIMTAVPRLYEIMHQRIEAGVKRKGGLSAKLFNRAVALGRRDYEQGLGSLARLENRILEKLVRAKVAARFGGRLKAFVSGGAPLNYDVGVFFLALGVRLLQGYGQTETAPVVSCNPADAIRIHTVGPAFPGVEVKIAEDGEILVRGELTMDGYWNNPDATAEVLRDGWIHTGDIGKLDDQGYIQITDRKKDIIVNSGGDNIAPQRVEAALNFEPEIDQSMVYGDRKPNLVAVVVPDPEFIGQWAKDNDTQADLAALSQDTAFRDAIKAGVDRANARLSQIEQVRRFIIASEAFTTENALMTPSLKIRRHMIKDVYGEALEGLYAR